MNVHSHYRSPFAPRMHFDEAAAGTVDGAAAAAAAAAASAKPWFDGIDAETIGHWDNKGWKKDDPKALVTEITKAWKGLERHFGAPADRILRLPDKPEDEAGWSAVRQKLGAPKEAKEYDFSTIKRANGTDVEASLSDALRNSLYKAGTPKDAATDVLRSVVKHMDDVDAARAAERTAKVTSEQNGLRQEWGTNFEFNRLTAMQGARRLVGGDQQAAEGVINAMQEAIGYKGTMEFFRKLGAGTTDDTFIEGGSGGNPVTMNGAIARRAQLEKDPEFNKRYLAGDPKARAEMDALITLITGAAA